MNPETMRDEFRLTYAWLRDNGIDEMLPENPRIVVDNTAGTVTVDAWQWRPVDRWDGRNIVLSEPGVAAREQRRSTLTTPLNAQMRQALHDSGAELIEISAD